MNTKELGRLVAEGAVLGERNVAADWAELNVLLGRPVMGPAVTLANSGRLEQALRFIGTDSRLAKAAQTWPRVLASARPGLDALPTRRSLAVPLFTVAVYCALLSLVQLVAATLLSLKVVPVFVQMSVDFHSAQVSDPFEALRLLMPLQLVLWVLFVWLARSPRASWNDDLALAAHAVIGAGLLEAKAPRAMVAGWLAEEPRLVADSSHVELRDDLRAVATSLSNRAEARMKRFAVGVRFAALALVTMQGLWVLSSIYRQLSLFPGAL